MRLNNLYELHFKTLHILLNALNGGVVSEEVAEEYCSMVAFKKMKITIQNDNWLMQVNGYHLTQSGLSDAIRGF